MGLRSWSRHQFPVPGDPSTPITAWLPGYSIPTSPLELFPSLPFFSSTFSHPSACRRNPAPSPHPSPLAGVDVFTGMNGVLSTRLKPCISASTPDPGSIWTVAGFPRGPGTTPSRKDAKGDAAVSCWPPARVASASICQCSFLSAGFSASAQSPWGLDGLDLPPSQGALRSTQPEQVRF